MPTIATETSVITTMDLVVYYVWTTWLLIFVETKWAPPPPKPLSPADDSDQSNPQQQLSIVPPKMSDLLPWFICVLLGHIVTSYASKTTIYTCMDSHTMFLSVLLWLGAAYTPRIYLHHQESLSILVYYIVVCGRYFNYGCNTPTKPAKCLGLRRYPAPDADSSSSTCVPYWSVIPTPEDMCLCSSKEIITGAVTTTKASTKSL